MKRVGLTGGMGCGKSTVAAEFRRLGVPCFVSDIVASGYYYDLDFLDELRQLLGDGVFLPDGSADKRAVAVRVFADRQLLEGLNAMVHPRVKDDFDAFCRRYADAPYVIFESAILYDYGFDRLMDRVVCVYLDIEERLRRLLLRDGVGEEAIRARIANQIPAEEMMRRADYVILNYEGNPRQRQVAYIDKLLRQ
ncbi:MAG: dephospho-CoA kinase [Bacteroidales bacterium]|nr:dephospho-CoA kinase [Bacteroidales bacterium]